MKSKKNKSKNDKTKKSIIKKIKTKDFVKIALAASDEFGGGASSGSCA